MATSLLIISDREPLAWLIAEQRFAVPAARLATAPPAGDRLLLYTTRGCYRNPTRDRGLVMGVADVVESASLLDQPLRFREREFRAGFRLRVHGLARPHEGVELAPHAGRLDALPDAASWSVRLRRSVVPLTDADVHVLEALLTPLLRPVEEVAPGYLVACKAGALAQTDSGAG